MFAGAKEFADFVTSDNLMVNTYPLYSPKQYDPFRSLVYLKTDNSIMSESIGMGDKMFKIDNCTLEILNSLGWNLPMETSVSKFDVMTSEKMGWVQLIILIHSIWTLKEILYRR